LRVRFGSLLKDWRINIDLTWLTSGAPQGSGDGSDCGLTVRSLKAQIGLNNRIKGIRPAR